MEMRQFKIFCAVADEGSFTAASEKIHTVQSNITQRIKELELELGQQLFVRHKSGVTLTPAGQTFLGYARRILQLSEECRETLGDETLSQSALRIGAMETTAAIRLPPILAPFRKAWPKVQLSLITGTTAELLKAVESRQIDGAFVGGFHQNSALHQEVVFQEELVLLSGTEHGSLKELTQHMSGVTVLAFRAGCFYRSTLESWLLRKGLTPNQTLELGTLDGILSCVAAGMGVTLLPRSVADQYASRMPIRSHDLPSEFARIETVFIRRNDTQQSKSMEGFLEIVRGHNTLQMKNKSAQIKLARSGR